MSLFLRSIFILTFCLPVFADTTSEDVNVSENNVKNALHAFHEDIEHQTSNDSSKLQNLLNQWVSNFNLMRVGFDVHRSAQMKYYQDGGKSEYIKNFPVLASLYMLSHSIEIISGPVGVYAASELGLGSTAQMIIGSVGAIITVPGLDPLCILLFAVSPLKPVQKAMTGIRMIAVKVSGGITNRLQLKNLMSKFFESRDRLSDIALTEIPYLQLNFETRDGKTWIKSLEVDKEILKQNPKAGESALAKFNLSARSALMSAIKNPKKTFYMNAFENTDSATKIQFKDYAVLLKPKVRFKKEFQTETRICQSLFH